MDVQDYLRLPYHIGMVRSATADGDAGWVAWVEELDGCISQGDTPAEAASMIYEAMELWIETVLEGGGAVPFPRPEPAHSGRFQVRLPSSLHSALVRAAEREGVSLNQYVSNSLAAASGWWEVGEGSRGARVLTTELPGASTRGWAGSTHAPPSPPSPRARRHASMIAGSWGKGRSGSSSGGKKPTSSASGPGLGVPPLMRPAQAMNTTGSPAVL